MGLLTYIKLGAVAGCLLAVYLGYTYVVGLQERNAQYQLDIQAQSVTIATRDGQLTAREEEIDDYKGRLLEAAAERATLDADLKQARENSNYMKGVFADHDFAKLLEKKPGLIGRRMRDATRRVFGELEQASRGISRDQKPGDNLPAIPTP